MFFFYRKCEQDETVYSAFNLSQYLNIDKVTNYRTWHDFNAHLKNLTLINELEILSPALQVNLQILATLTDVNLTYHRERLSSPISRRDLASFADQLNAVARQLNDAPSARRIDNIAFFVRKTVNGEWSGLNAIRKRIIYKITLLEVLLKPLHKQVNQSLAHLKSIQFFIDTKGWAIADKVNKSIFTRIIQGDSV